jgi:GNAT superfamily N-acetyltransferase
MRDIRIRTLDPSDLPAVSGLFDATLGQGFWSLDPESLAGARVAEIDGAVAGAGSATLIERLDEAPDLRGPVGLIRTVAVGEMARRRGVGTLLVDALVAYCLDAGATSLVGFAWVRGDSGVCPLGGVLAGLGFEKRRRLESFYAADEDARCPVCGRVPCICAADLYVRSSG